MTIKIYKFEEGFAVKTQNGWLTINEGGHFEYSDSPNDITTNPYLDRDNPKTEQQVLNFAVEVIKEIEGFRQWSTPKLIKEYKI
jgi:hypothetical protein